MAKIYGQNSRYLERKHLRHRSISKIYTYFIYLFYVYGIVILLVGILDYTFNQRVGISIIGLLFLVLAHFINKKANSNHITAKNFRQGQKGEWEVKVELARLPDNYAVFCDAKFMGKNYNIDFIVSGPTGIYAIEVKSHKGNIKVSNIYQTYFDQASRAALKLRDFLWYKTAEGIWIKPLLVYSSDEANVQTTNAQKAITVIHKNNLAMFIQSQQDISKRFDIFKYENHLIALTGHNLL